MSDDSLKPTRSLLGYTLAAIGVVLVGLGLSWSMLVPSEVYWSEVDAQEWTDATDRVHAARSKPVEPNGQADTELAAAIERLGLAEQKLERARGLRRHTGTALSVTGAVMAATGVFFLRRAG